MVRPICLRRLGLLDFIETTAIMLGVGLAPSVTVTNNVILHTTEMKWPGHQRGTRWEMTASERLHRGHFCFVLGGARMCGKTPMAKGVQMASGTRGWLSLGILQFAWGPPTPEQRASSVLSTSGCFSGELMQDTPLNSKHPWPS